MNVYCVYLYKTKIGTLSFDRQFTNISQIFNIFTIKAIHECILSLSFVPQRPLSRVDFRKCPLSPRTLQDDVTSWLITWVDNPLKNNTPDDISIHGGSHNFALNTLQLCLMLFKYRYRTDTVHSVCRVDLQGVGMCQLVIIRSFLNILNYIS